MFCEMAMHWNLANQAYCLNISTLYYTKVRHAMSLGFQLSGPDGKDGVMVPDNKTYDTPVNVHYLT